MKVLLDECIDRRLARDLPDLDVQTVPKMGWSGITNGHLIKLAEKDFDVFVTVDRNLSFQQNLAQFKIAVIVLHSRSNRLSDLQPFAAKLIDGIGKVEPGSLLIISNDDLEL